MKTCVHCQGSGEVSNPSTETSEDPWAGLYICPFCEGVGKFYTPSEIIRNEAIARRLAQSGDIRNAAEVLKMTHPGIKMYIQERKVPFTWKPCNAIPDPYYIEKTKTEAQLMRFETRGGKTVEAFV